MTRTVLFLTAIALLTGCDPSLIDNERLQRWCGERPCGWEVSGDIERVGTWHSDDYAVSFTSDHAQLSQLNATVSSRQAECFEFTMLAQIERGVRMYLELDFLDDGVIDFSQPLPESHFDPLRFLITTPTWYRGVRFILRKDGPGRAVLAELDADEAWDCDNPPVELRERPFGAPCERNDQCESGMCQLDTCSSCSDASACAEGELCGAVPGSYGYGMACVTPGADGLGDRCEQDAECQSGICCDGLCSECCSADDCEQGDCSLPADFPNGEHHLPEFSWPWPHQCAPGTAARAAGAECASDSDCANGVCEGSERACERERERCDEGDDECVDFCFATRVYGGVCH